MREKRNDLKPQLFVIGAALVLIVVLLIGYWGYQSYIEQRIIYETQESVLRQDRQHLQEEAKAAEQAAANDDSLNIVTNTSTPTQSFNGTLQLSSYHERASEVDAPVSMFPDAPIMLLTLETPTSVTGYNFGDDALSTREITVIRVPDSIAANGEKISIEVQDPVSFPSDVSGLLWDLDLSELESLKAEHR